MGRVKASAVAVVFSATSILVNIPGEAAPVVTCFDGYQMAEDYQKVGTLLRPLIKK